MLRTRLENEQVKSTLSFSMNNRSKKNFITTDRPDSSHLVDLHIYIVPKSVWKNVQHLAQNEAMNDAISAGFVRVSPDLHLRDLRKPIEQFCGKENFFPRDYIFLRSVGRCLTRVKPTQENQLKVKNYRPPQIYASEIYLLEGRHEDYAHIPSISPALSSTSYVFGNRHSQHSNHDDHDRSSTKFNHYYIQKIHSENANLPNINTINTSRIQIPLSERRSWTKSIRNSSGHTITTNLTQLKEEQERLRRRQVEIERITRAMAEIKIYSAREENDRRRRRRQDKLITNPNEEEYRRRRQIEQLDEERRRLEQEVAALKIQATYRGYKDRKQFRERQKTYEKERRATEIKRRQQSEEDKRKTKELGEQRKIELAKRKNDENFEPFRTRFSEIRTESNEIEKKRDETIKYVTYLHGRLTIRRKEVRDQWKKKYFAEKKKTPSIEEQCDKLKNDLDEIQKKIIKNIENEVSHLSHDDKIKQTDLTNFILQKTKNQFEIQDLRQQLDYAKLRLTTDVKLRNQAETECQTLKYELTQAKMNLNHMKNNIRH